MTSAKVAFQQRGQKQDAAVFDYEREVRQVWRDFPRIKNKVYFLELGAEAISPVYPGNPRIKEALGQFFKKQHELWAEAQYLREEQKSSGYQSYDDNNLGIVCLYTGEDRFPLLAASASLTQELTFSFDHELGHAIVPDGVLSDYTHLKECIADAYATIRHLQRAGAGSSVIDAVVEKRALQFIFQKTEGDYFTSPVTEKILARRHEIDWNSLTPQETTRLARRFALEYALHPRDLQVLDKSFHKFHGKLNALRKGNVTLLRDLAEKVLSTDTPDVFKWGAVVLNAALKGHFRRPPYSIILSGDYWDAVRQKLAEKQKIFAAQGEIMFGLVSPDRSLQRRSSPAKIMAR